MSKNNTDASNVIPFDFRGHAVRAVTIDGEPWFVASDVCKILGQSNTTKALYSLDDDERSNFKLGRQGMANIINESGLYTLTLRCDDAVKKGSTAHTFRRWVASEVLPAIRKHGRYEDTGNKMATLMDELIGMSELNVIKGLIRDKAKAVPVAMQQSFALTMHRRLHTRFNVPRTELIPAGQFEQACNFIGSYVLEGEYLPHRSGELPDKLRPDERYLVHSDSYGNRCVEPIATDALIMSAKKFIAVIGAHGELVVHTDDLLAAISAISERLRSRVNYKSQVVAA